MSVVYCTFWLIMYVTSNLWETAEYFIVLTIFYLGKVFNQTDYECCCFSVWEASVGSEKLKITWFWFANVVLICMISFSNRWICANKDSSFFSHKWNSAFHALQSLMTLPCQWTTPLNTLAKHRLDCPPWFWCLYVHFLFHIELKYSEFKLFWMLKVLLSGLSASHWFPVALPVSHR